MAQEQTQRFGSSSNGGGGGDGSGGGGFNGIGGNGCSSSKSSKKPKQKKVPQRGLGVAQLERMRLEEQHKRDPSLQQQHVTPPMFPSSNPPSFNVPSFRHNPSSSSIPLLSPPPPPPPPPPPMANPPFRNPSSFPNNEFPNPNLIPSLSKPSNGIGGLDHHGFGFRGNGNLPYESNNPIWNSPNLIQRTQQFQHQPYSSPMVNVSSGTSSSSGISYQQQMEHPSVHYMFGKDYTATMGHEEDQVVVGRKRPYPFSLSDASGSTFTGMIPHFSTTDESFRNGNTLNVDPSHPILRNGGWRSSSMPDMSSKGNGVENGNLTRDFLSLALPPTGSIRPGSNHYTQSSNGLSLNLGISGNGDLSYQEDIQIPVLNESWPSESNQRQQQPLHGVFPPATAMTDGASTSGTRCNGEGGDELDLDLKL